MHVDHQLQPESARWSAHCRRRARAARRPPRGAPHRRAARARCLARGGGARWPATRPWRDALRPHELLLTAHHQDDQLETVLLQLLRGAGVARTGRHARERPVCARPAAAAAAARSRAAQLRAWLRARRLDWVEDDSNADERLRPQLPAPPGAAGAAARAGRPPPATVARSARHLAEAQQLLDALGAARLPRAPRSGRRCRRRCCGGWIPRGAAMRCATGSRAAAFPGPARAPPGGDRRRRCSRRAPIRIPSSSGPACACAGTRQLLRLEAATASAARAPPRRS